MAEEKKSAEKKPVKKTAAAKKSAASKKTAPKKVAAKPAVRAVGTTKSERRGKKEKRSDGYIYAVGRRKRAVAQVRLYPEGKGEITVNGKDYKDYFPVYALREAVMAPLTTVGLENIKIDAKVSGGGVRGQAEAVRLGVSRALLLVNADWRASLKKQGFLTRDPREKERKKPGLKKARRAPQWAKR